MSTSSRLTKILESESTKTVGFNDSSRFVVISDCHRGDNSWADDFADNHNIFYHALQNYYDEGFTYIEVGDGDELWKNRKFGDIRSSYKKVFALLKDFYDNKRAYFLYGNHDMVKRNPGYVKKNFYKYNDSKEKVEKELFKDVVFLEGLKLRYEPTGDVMLVVHGHQGDLINDTFWKLGRFMVRYLWRPLETIGIKDPTSPAKDGGKKEKVEKRLIDWIEEKKTVLIAGHTHRTMFPKVGETPYFNDGSCVSPRCIKAMEIKNGAICLVRWEIVADKDGLLKVVRDEINGPEKLINYFDNMSGTKLEKQKKIEPAYTR